MVVTFSQYASIHLGKNQQPEEGGENAQGHDCCAMAGLFFAHEPDTEEEPDQR
jgi:hypothetical protein